MKKEIKFNAVDKQDGDYIRFDDWLEEQPEFDCYNEALASFFEYYFGYEMLQYIGIKDKNGIEIYEGDIVKLKYVSYVLEVKYNSVLACYQMGNEHRFTALQDVEVVGNIHENRELLE